MPKAYELHPHVFLSDWNNPNIALVKGKGMYQWDVNGNEYLDSCSGAVNVSLGYGREDISEVIRKQAVELSYLTRFTSVPPILDECSNVLADFTGMDRFFMTSGGSEANEMAFRIAGSMAIKEALKKADPVLMEPVMNVEVVVPEEYMGDVIGDLSSRRGRVAEMGVRANARIVKAFVPLAEMFGYATDLRSKTSGRASYTMSFDHYEEVPRNVAEELLKN